MNGSMNNNELAYRIMCLLASTPPNQVDFKCQGLVEELLNQAHPGSSMITNNRDMNRAHARKLANTVSNYEVLEMLRKAKEGIKDWMIPSRVNKGATKGVAWNVFAKDFDPEQKYHYLVLTNMIREFGEFLPEDMQPKKRRNPKD